MEPPTRVEPLSSSHHSDLGRNLYQAPDSDPEIWKYLPTQPEEETSESFIQLLKRRTARLEEFYYSIVDNANSESLGFLGLDEVVVSFGRAEIGPVIFSKKLQRSAKGTEAVYLVMKHCFDLGFRRVEWHCDDGNERSKNAAKRYGFSFEGVLKKHMFVRGSNRDTALFSLLDDDWPRVRKGFEDWLSEENMSQDGIQKEKLKVSCDLTSNMSRRS